MDDVTDGDNSLPQLPSPHWRQERSNGHSPLVAAPVDMGEWEVHPDQVVVEHKLGQGTFGDVYTGVLVGGEVTPPINRKECDQTNVVIQILPSKIIYTFLGLNVCVCLLFVCVSVLFVCVCLCCL